MDLSRKREHCTLIANFGGPRDLSEVGEFLETLLTDRDVVRTRLPTFLNTALFRWIARRRSKKIAHDYALIGGRSPIYADTESVADQLRSLINGEVVTFHRYLPATHPEFIDRLSRIQADVIDVFPMIPQFTHATTGSIAGWMKRYLPDRVARKLSWVKSYPDHPAFVRAYKGAIESAFQRFAIDPADALLLFSAHGIPQSFLKGGDPYPSECERSYNAVKAFFPRCATLLAYQSKFGPGEWLRPYTSEVAEEIIRYAGDRRNVLFIPISFTSDHIETLFEVEMGYLATVVQKGLNAIRVDALNLSPAWIEAIPQILSVKERYPTEALIRLK